VLNIECTSYSVDNINTPVWIIILIQTNQQFYYLFCKWTPEAYYDDDKNFMEVDRYISKRVTSPLIMIIEVVLKYLYDEHRAREYLYMMNVSCDGILDIKTRRYYYAVGL